MKKTYPSFIAIMFLFMSGSCFAQHEYLFKKLNRGARALTSSATATQTAPTISGIQLQTGNTIVILGGNLQTVTSLHFDTTTVTADNYTLDPSGSVIVTGLSSPKTITLETAVGTATFTLASRASSSRLNPGITAFTPPPASTQAEGELTAAADFTIPEVGQSDLNIIVTPTFTLNRVFYDSRIAVSGSVWGNTFGLDSVRSKLGAKMLLPQSSMFGMNFNGEYIWKKTNDPGKMASLGFGTDLNLLYKKVAFLDTASRKATNFTPFVFHPKIGITASFFNAAIQTSFYYNIMCVLSENDNVKKFFSTEKNVFIYPECNVSGVFFVDKAQKQTIKVGFNILVNNKDAKVFSGSTDSVVPYLKIGLLSSL